ncbi:hypothetical protein ABID65_008890 [Bradyrhizobium sp. S3.9.2]
MRKVGTGWDWTTSGKMRKALDTLASPESKLSKQLKKPKATGLSLFLLRKSNTATSPPKDCCEQAP